ncbi:MAG: hypothetical protein ACYDBZ_05250 [Steroidobacteraceae bacterium]
MSKPALIRPIYLLGAAVLLAPIAAAGAAPPAKHVKVSHSIPHPAAAPHRDEHDERGEDTQPWMMLLVGLATIGFAVRRQQRALDSLQPQIN